MRWSNISYRALLSNTGRHAAFRVGKHSSNLVYKSIAELRSWAMSPSGNCSMNWLALAPSLCASWSSASSTTTAGTTGPRQLSPSSIALCSTVPFTLPSVHSKLVRLAMWFASQPCTVVSLCLLTHMALSGDNFAATSASPSCNCSRMLSITLRDSGCQSGCLESASNTSCCIGFIVVSGGVVVSVMAQSLCHRGVSC